MSIKFKLNKLNKKGFTLIELLAVIVILAIILVIAMPMALDAMNNSRISSLHSSAKGVANWFAEASVADALVPGEMQTIHEDMYTKINNQNGAWFCMKDITIEGQDKSLFEAAELSTEEIVKDGAAYTGSGVPTNGTCASMKINPTGSPEVVLVANPSGKFGIAGRVTYAISSQPNGNKCSGGDCPDTKKE